MKNKESKTKVGFRPIAGAVRYTIKNRQKTRIFDVIKAKKPAKQN